MLMPRGGVGVAGLGGYLYAVGGNDGAASLQSVEKYNPHTNKWSRVAPMNRRRAGGTHILYDYQTSYMTCIRLFQLTLSAQSVKA